VRNRSAAFRLANVFDFCFPFTRQQASYRLLPSLAVRVRMKPCIVLASQAGRRGVLRSLEVADESLAERGDRGSQILRAFGRHDGVVSPVKYGQSQVVELDHQPLDQIRREVDQSAAQSVLDRHAVLATGRLRHCRQDPEVIRLELFQQPKEVELLVVASRRPNGVAEELAIELTLGLAPFVGYPPERLLK